MGTGALITVTDQPVWADRSSNGRTASMGRSVHWKRLRFPQQTPSAAPPQPPRSCFSSVKLYHQGRRPQNVILGWNWGSGKTKRRGERERASERARETERESCFSPGTEWLCIRMSRWWIWLALAGHIRRKAQMPRHSHFHKSFSPSLSLALSLGAALKRRNTSSPPSRRNEAAARPGA